MPTAKLPILYLVDSISKNIGAPFTTELLPYVIPRMFLSAYREVDGVTKAKLEEMVNLWRTTGPDGVDLYGQRVREEVERDIFGMSGPTPGYMRGPYPSRERVLQTIHATLAAKHREVNARPWDPEARKKIDTLQQVLDVVTNRQLPPEELQKIMVTMQQMTAVQAPPPTLPPQHQAPAPPGMYPTYPPVLPQSITTPTSYHPPQAAGHASRTSSRNISTRSEYASVPTPLTSRTVWQHTATAHPFALSTYSATTRCYACSCCGRSCSGSSYFFTG